MIFCLLKSHFCEALLGLDTREIWKINRASAKAKEKIVRKKEKYRKVKKEERKKERKKKDRKEKEKELESNMK